MSDDTGLPTIGGYELLEWLGSGNMADVYRARQKSLDRVVALKILHDDLTRDREFKARFLQEARAAARLDHENIVAVYDVGVSEGSYYIAMELVEGPDLDQLIETHGPLPEHSALRLAYEVAMALVVAHRAGIVHRDLKPDNVLLTRDNHAKLADLGLAKDPGGDPELSQEGFALGTPVTFSPEQAQGRADLDTRSDLYALGVVLFFLLTGRYPFDGEDAQTIMRQHLEDPVPDPKRFAPQLSDRTRQLIFWLMQKDRRDRPDHPVQVVQAIEELLIAQGETVERGRSRRRGALVATLVVVLLALVGAAGYALTDRPQPEPPLALDRQLKPVVVERLAAAELERLRSGLADPPLVEHLPQLRSFYESYPETEAGRWAQGQIDRLEGFQQARLVVEASIERSRRMLEAGELLKAWGELEAIPDSNLLPPLDEMVAGEQERIVEAMAQRLDETRPTIVELLEQQQFSEARSRADDLVAQSVGEVKKRAQALLVQVETAEEEYQAKAPARAEADRSRFREGVLEIRRLVEEGGFDAVLRRLAQVPSFEDPTTTDRWKDQERCLLDVLEARRLALGVLKQAREQGQPRSLQFKQGKVSGTIVGVSDEMILIQTEADQDPERLWVADLEPVEIMDGVREYLGGRNGDYYRIAASYSMFLGYLGDAREQLEVAEAFLGREAVAVHQRVLEQHRSLFPEDASRRRSAAVEPAPEDEPERVAEEPEEPSEDPAEEEYWTASRKQQVKRLLVAEPQFREPDEVSLIYPFEKAKELKDFEWLKRPSIDAKPKEPEKGPSFRAEQAAKWRHKLPMGESFTIAFRITMRNTKDGFFALTFGEQEDYHNYALNFGRGLYQRTSAEGGYKLLGKKSEDGLTKWPLDRELRLVIELQKKKLVVRIGEGQGLKLYDVPMEIDKAGYVGFEVQNVEFQMHGLELSGQVGIE